MKCVARQNRFEKFSLGVLNGGENSNTIPAVQRGDGGMERGDTPKVFQGSERNTFVKQIYFFQRRAGLKERAFVEFPHELETSVEWKSFEIGLFAQKSSGSQT